MTTCDLKWDGNEGVYRCECGNRATVAGATLGPCNLRSATATTATQRSSKPDAYSLQATAAGDRQAEVWGVVHRMRSLATEAIRWAWAGFPLRTDEQLAVVQAACLSCEKLKTGTDGRHSCGVCGCRASAGPDEFAVKPLMATTHCPLDPPKW